MKPLPPPPEDLEALAAVRRAVPLAPRREIDCCTRLVSRGHAPGRDAARTWLSFLAGLDLVAERDGQFYRSRREIDREALAEAFVGGVYGAAEVLAVLDGSGALSADEVFERFEPMVPAWERTRDPAWREAWCRRTADLLDWLTLVGRAERTTGGYSIL